MKTKAHIATLKTDERLIAVLAAPLLIAGLLLLISP